MGWKLPADAADTRRNDGLNAAGEGPSTSDWKATVREDVGTVGAELHRSEGGGGGVSDLDLDLDLDDARRGGIDR